MQIESSSVSDSIMTISTYSVRSMEDVYTDDNLSDPAAEQTKLVTLAADGPVLDLTQPSSSTNSSTNSNGNANSEIAEVDASLSTSSTDSISATIPFQLNYTQTHDHVSWLPSLGATFMHSFLNQPPSSDSVSSPTTKESLPLLATSEAVTLCNMDTSSHLSMISSPSSTTTTSSGSPPDSAAILCSPPSSLLPHQGIFVDMLARQAAGSSQDGEEERSTPQVCLWQGCNTEFQSLSLLVTHLDKGHTLAMSQYVCYWKDCPRNFKPFDARYKLITHLRCHTGEKPFKCEVPSCNRCFSRLENLKLHVRTHTGEKPYECHYGGCSKRFNNTSDRAKHMKTHVTRKPYACKYPGCEKSYTDPSSMRKHIKYSHKLKEKQERGSTSGSSNDTILDVNGIVSLKKSASSSSSLARTPSLSPSFMFHGPTVTALSPPIHAPLATLPQESARIAHSTATVANLKRNFVDGAQLIATGPVISSQPQVPHLIPIPLVQLPAGTHYQNQLLGLLPGGPKGMILMPTASSTENFSSQRQQAVPPRHTPEPTPAVTNASNGNGTGGTEDTNKTASQKNIEAQLRRQILELQQELSHTQTLLVHQNAAIAHRQSKPILRQPMLLQQLPPPRMIARPPGHMTVSGDLPPTTFSTGAAVASLNTPTPAGSAQFIPLVNSQGLQFLYTPSVPRSTI